MRRRLPFLVALLMLALGSCSRELPDELRVNRPPKTFLWLFPDSTIAEGHSRQHIRWWGEDPDGIVTGYLFASGKLYAGTPQGAMLDTITWRWVTSTDSVVAFPLLVRRDTFQVMVRAVDNTFGLQLSDQSVIRFEPEGALPGSYLGPPFWDRNENGAFDGDDVPLVALRGATDPKSAALGFPLLNQKPRIAYEFNPNDPTAVMEQPETTFTAVTFSWIGTDPDGDHTVAAYEFVLNDTTLPENIFTVSRNVRLISLVVPRNRTDGLTGVQSVSADIWTGTYRTTRTLIGTLPNLKLDTLNSFYVRSRDVAGDVSPFRRLPSTANKPWFVKRPKGRLLIVNDNISTTTDSILGFYHRVLASVGDQSPSLRPIVQSPEVLNIARYGAPTAQWARLKQDGRVGLMVPPFIDPALIFTLHLFDVVFWYTDLFPSLGVAEFPLFQYVRDHSHRGKVIFSTAFQTAIDPRGSLKVFAPIDSVSTTPLEGNRLFPALGESQVLAGTPVLPDSTDPTNIFPYLQFGGLPPTAFAVYMRPLYKRADARYIYRMPPDPRNRYAFVLTASNLRAVTAIGNEGWVVGDAGSIYYSSDAGVNWERQKSEKSTSLGFVQFTSPTRGWILGDLGTILTTDDGGSTWQGASVVTLESLLSGDFRNDGRWTVVGTNGLFIRTTNGGSTWSTVNIRTRRTIRSIHFGSPDLGIAVGDSGFVARSSDGGATWQEILPRPTQRRLFSIRFLNTSVAIAVAGPGPGTQNVFRSTDGGQSWAAIASLSATELRSIYFLDERNGWICGTNGNFFLSNDGGSTWTPGTTGISHPNSRGQNLNAVVFTSEQRGWTVGTGGVILRSENGGFNWTMQPQGSLHVAVVDGPSLDDRKRSFVFVGLPLHFLDGTQRIASGNGNLLIPFFQHVLQHEFGF